MSWGMSWGDRLLTLAICGGILAIAGIVHLFQKYKKGKKLQQALQQRKREEAALKQDKNYSKPFQQKGQQ